MKSFLIFTFILSITSVSWAQFPNEENIDRIGKNTQADGPETSTITANMKSAVGLLEERLPEDQEATETGKVDQPNLYENTTPGQARGKSKRKGSTK